MKKLHSILLLFFLCVLSIQSAYGSFDVSKQSIVRNQLFFGEQFTDKDAISLLFGLLGAWWTYQAGWYFLKPRHNNHSWRICDDPIVGSNSPGEPLQQYILHRDLGPMVFYGLLAGVSFAGSAIFLLI